MYAGIAENHFYKAHAVLKFAFTDYGEKESFEAFQCWIKKKYRSYFHGGGSLVK